MAKEKSTDLTSLLQDRRKQNSQGETSPVFEEQDRSSSTQAFSQSETNTIHNKNEKRPIGRPPGRRSNPKMSTSTLILSKKVKAEANYHISLHNLDLASSETKLNLSILVEHLLQDWIESQKG